MEKISFIDNEKKTVKSPYILINIQTDNESIKSHMNVIKIAISLADALRTEEYINLALSKTKEIIDKLESQKDIDVLNSLFAEMNKLGGIEVDLHTKITNIVNDKINKLSEKKEEITKKLNPEKILTYLEKCKNLQSELKVADIRDYPLYITLYKKIKKEVIADEELPNSLAKQKLLKDTNEMLGFLSTKYERYIEIEFGEETEEDKENKKIIEQEENKKKSQKESEYYSLKRNAIWSYDSCKYVDDYYQAKRRLQKAYDYLVTYKKILSDIYRKEEDELISLISQTKKMISRLEAEAAERKRKNRW